MSPNAVRIARRIAHVIHGEPVIDVLNALAQLAAIGVHEARESLFSFSFVVGRAHTAHVKQLKERNAMNCVKCWEPSGKNEFCEKHDPEKKAQPANATPPSSPAAAPTPAPAPAPVPAAEPDKKA